LCSRRRDGRPRGLEEGNGAAHNSQSAYPGESPPDYLIALSTCRRPYPPNETTRYHRTCRFQKCESLVAEPDLSSDASRYKSLEGLAEDSLGRGFSKCLAKIFKLLFRSEGWLVPQKRTLVIVSDNAMRVLFPLRRSFLLHWKVCMETTKRLGKGKNTKDNLEG
jgi:hypothetical protein